MGQSGIDASLHMRLYAMLMTLWQQLILWLPLPLGTGIAVYFAMDYEPTLWLAPLILAALVVTACFVGKREGDSAKWLGLCVLLIALIWSFAGFSVAQLRARSINTVLLAKPIKIAGLEGKISLIEPRPEGATRLVLEQIKYERSYKQKMPERVRLTIRKGGDKLQVGDRIKVLASLHPPSVAPIPDGYDFQRHAYFQRIGAYGFSFKEPVILQKASRTEGFAGYREKLIDPARELLPEDISGIVIALLTGQQAGIPEEVAEHYRISGLSHMLSVSGAHIGLMAGVVFFVLRFLLVLLPNAGLRWPIKKIAAVGALLAATAYTLFVGPLIPAVRSLLMTAIVLIAVLLDRFAVSFRLVAVAAIFLLLVWPESLINVSFQLSFAAVLALVAMYTYWQKRKLFKERKKPALLLKPFLWVGAVAATSLAATLATAPFVLVHFQQNAQYSILANALAMPALSFLIMPMACIVFLAWPLGLLHWPMVWMGKTVSIINIIAEWVTSLPGAQLTLTAPPNIVLPLSAIGLLLVCCMQGRARLWGLIPFVIASLAWVQTPVPRIFVADNGEQVLVRGDNGLYAAGVGKQGFTTKQWLAALNLRDAKFEKIKKSLNDDEIKCDVYGCRITLSEAKISLINEPYALAEECQWADLIISEAYLPACENAAVYDRKALKDAGSLSVAIDKRGNLQIRQGQHKQPHGHSKPWRN